jgi:hypothetical protein
MAHICSHPPLCARAIGDGGLVQIGIGKGESVAIWGGSRTPPKLVVEPKSGCASQSNFFGGGVVAESESRKAPTPSPASAINRTVLRPCSFGTDGMLVPGQRWKMVPRSAGAVALELQDGSGRCLSVGDYTSNGGTAVLRPCIPQLHGAASLPIGCQRPWTELDEWPRAHSSTPGHARCTIASQEFELGGPPRYWRNAIQIRGTDSCLGLHGGKNPETISFDGCQNCTAAHHCTVNNTEWYYNASSLALVSLCKMPCRAGGWCLTDVRANVSAKAEVKLEV